MATIRAKIINSNVSGLNLVPHLNKTVKILSEPGKKLEIETIDGQLRTFVPPQCLGGIGDSSTIFLSQCH